MSDLDDGWNSEEDLIKKHEIESWEASAISKIYPLLKGSICHRTSIEGYRGIKDSGFIYPNTGQYPYTYPQSKVYFASSKGYVSLFDFTSVLDRDCISNHHTWGKFFFDQEPVTIVLRLNEEHLVDRIPNNLAPKSGNAEYKGYIPYVEAWYPGPIPFGAINRLIISRWSGRDELPFFIEFSIEEIEDFEHEIGIIEKRWMELQANSYD